MIGQIFWLYYKALQTYALAKACESADFVKALTNSVVNSDTYSVYQAELNI